MKNWLKDNWIWMAVGALAVIYLSILAGKSDGGNVFACFLLRQKVDMSADPPTRTCIYDCGYEITIYAGRMCPVRIDRRLGGCR